MEYDYKVIWLNLRNIGTEINSCAADKLSQTNRDSLILLSFNYFPSGISKSSDNYLMKHK